MKGPLGFIGFEDLDYRYDSVAQVQRGPIITGSEFLAGNLPLNH